MKRYICYILLPALALASCAQHHHEGDHHEGGEEGHEEHGSLIELSDESAQLFGVEIDTVEAGDFHQVIRAAGTVEQGGGDQSVVSAPAGGIVFFAPGVEPGTKVAKGQRIATIDSHTTSGGDVNAAAAAELETASMELERIEDLYRERLATQAELIAAQSALNRAYATYSPVARAGVVIAPAAGIITALSVSEGQYVGAGEAIAAVGSANGSLLRADVARRHAADIAGICDMVADFGEGVRLQVSSLGGSRKGDAPAAGGYIPVYFTVKGGAAPSGSSFTAYLIGKERHGVLTVPVGALSEQQGRFYVYSPVMPGHYRKLAVTTGATDGIRTEVVSGLEAGTPVVVKGTPTVRLAETSAVAPQGHTHNH